MPQGTQPHYHPTAARRGHARATAGGRRTITQWLSTHLVPRRHARGSQRPPQTGGPRA
jgi:hypothetical protein